MVMRFCGGQNILLCDGLGPVAASASGPRQDALERCLTAHGAAEIHWGQIGRALYDRAHAKL
jgi:hypothetical protein